MIREHWEQKKRNLARGTEGFKRNSVSSILEKNKRGGGGDLETVGFLKRVGKQRGEGGGGGVGVGWGICGMWRSAERRKR